MHALGQLKKSMQKLGAASSVHGSLLDHLVPQKVTSHTENIWALCSRGDSGLIVQHTQSFLIHFQKPLVTNTPISGMFLLADTIFSQSLTVCFITYRHCQLRIDSGPYVMYVRSRTPYNITLAKVSNLKGRVVFSLILLTHSISAAASIGCGVFDASLCVLSCLYSSATIDNSTVQTSVSMQKLAL